MERKNKIIAKHIPQDLLDIVSYENGVLFYTVNRGSRKVDDVAGCLYSPSKNSSERGRRTRWRLKFKGNDYYRARVVWSIFNGHTEKMLDHINNNTLDDRIENLRECTNGQNQANRKETKSKTGVKGLRRQKFKRRDGSYHVVYVGVVDHNGRRHCTPKFPDTEKGKAKAVGLLRVLRTSLHKEFTHHG
tara:strand:- start:38 stop:604 length:567 start_codon:yes stop_codon:yes gene_type:complete